MCKHYVTVVLNLCVLWLATSILNMIDPQKPSQGVDLSLTKIQKPIVYKNVQNKQIASMPNNNFRLYVRQIQIPPFESYACHKAFYFWQDLQIHKTEFILI